MTNKYITYIEFNDRKQLLQNKKNFKNFNCEVKQEYFDFFEYFGLIKFTFSFNVKSKYHKDNIDISNIKCPYINYSEKNQFRKVQNNVKNFYVRGDNAKKARNNIPEESNAEFLRMGSAEQQTGLLYSLKTGKVYIVDYYNDLFKKSDKILHLLFDSLSEFKTALGIDDLSEKLNKDTISDYILSDELTLEHYEKYIADNKSFEGVEFKDEDFEYDIYPEEPKVIVEEEFEHSNILLKDHLVKSNTDENIIKSVENRFGIVIPEQLRNFYLNYRIDFEAFLTIDIKLEQLDNLDGFSLRYFLKLEQLENDTDNIIDFNLEVNDYLKANMFIFGYEGDGLLIIDLETAEIYYEDSGMYFEHSKVHKDNVYKIASSFDELLSKIHFLSDISLESFQKQMNKKK